MSKKVLVSMQHTLTPAQVQDLGVSLTYLKDLDSDLYNKLCNCPTERHELIDLACALLNQMYSFDIIVWPIGSPAFQFALTEYLLDARKYRDTPTVLFSHSIRKSIEKTKDDGTIEKVSVFEHVKYIEM